MKYLQLCDDYHGELRAPDKKQNFPGQFLGSRQKYQEC